jgi:hypothetical protein
MFKIMFGCLLWILAAGGAWAEEKRDEGVRSYPLGPIE